MGEELQVVSDLLTEFVDDKVKGLIEKKEWMEECSFNLIRTREEFTDLVDRLIELGLCSLDLETTSLNTRLGKDGKSRARIVGVCLAESKYVGYYVPVSHEDKEYNLPYDFVVRELGRLVKNCKCIYHFFKFDGQVLRNHGIEIDDETMYDDTHLMAGVDDAASRERGLKALSESKLGREMIDIAKLGVQSGKKRLIRFDLVPPQIAVYYGCSDAMNTFGLYEHFVGSLDEQDPDRKAGPWAVYEKIEKRCQFAVMEMERSLCRLDIEYLQKKREELVGKMRACVASIYEAAGREFDVNSPKQMGVVLFEEMKLKYPEREKTASGQYKTDEGTLQKIADAPIVKMILEYRGLEKVIGTYVDNFLNNVDEDGFVKFQLNQLRADTGRFSASGGKGLHEDGYCKVNCQNIPKPDEDNPDALDLRGAIIARDGFKIVAIDYSGEELRIAANFSREPKWLDVFLRGSGDLHLMTAQVIYNDPSMTADKNKKERSKGKCVAKGTRVALKRGWVPIEEVKVGDRVVTKTGKLGLVESVHDMGIKPGAEVLTSSGHRVTCGLNHRFLMEDGKTWTRAEDLKEGDVIRTVSCASMKPPRNQRLHFNFWNEGKNNMVSDSLPYIEANPLWGKLFGYLMGDGHTHPYYAGLCCSDMYREVKEDMVNTVESLGLPCSAKRRKRKGAKNWLWTINVGSTIFSRFCKEIGFRGKRKKVLRIPRWVFESTKKVQAAFLQGLFETDGAVGVRAAVSFCTKDEELARDVMLMLASFGIKAYMYPKRNQVYGKTYYEVEMGRAGSKIFRRKIGFVSNRKRERLSEYDDKPMRATMTWTTKVKSVKRVGPTELMDLTVKGNHTYVAEGLVTHNTLNFLTLFGGGASRFAAQAKIPFETAKKMIINFFRGYSVLKKWIDDEIKRSRRRGYSKTAFGRRRPLREFYVATDKKVQAKGDRCAINSAVQGSGADIIKIAMYRCWKWIRENGYGDDIRMLMPIHDEIVFEVREDKLDFFVPELCEIMKLQDLIEALGWPIPLEVDAEYGDSFHVDHDYWKERGGAPVKPVEAPPQQRAVSEGIPEPKPEVTAPTPSPRDGHAKEGAIAEQHDHIRDPQSTVTAQVGDTSAADTMSDGQFMHFTVTVREAALAASEKARDRLERAASAEPDEALQDVKIKDRIDHRGVFLYPIEKIDMISVHQFEAALRVLAFCGDSTFIGPRCRVSLVNKATGEVWFESSKKVSLDAFLAICLWLKI